MVELERDLRRYVLANDRQGAIRHLSSNGGRHDLAAFARRFGYDVATVLRRLATAAPDRVDADWANVLVCFGNLAAAGSVLAKLESQAIGERTHLLSAEILAGAGRLADALKVLTVMLKETPRCADAFYLRSRILTRLDRHDEARKELAAAALLAPADVRYRMALGNAAKRVGNYQEAIAEYSVAIGHETNFADLWNNRGTAYQALGQSEIARQDFMRAAELDQQHLFARLNLGSLLFQEKSFAEAARTFEVAIAIDPTSADAHYGLGLCLHSQSLHESAIRSFDAAVMCNPRYHKAFFAKANSLQSLDRIEEAISQYEKAVAVNHSYREAYINWAVALQELGRHKDVIALLEPVLAQWPDFNEARWNLANSILCFGPSRSGWETYEARHALVSGEKLASYGLPALGLESPAGKRIFVQWDQRFGDIIQMLRYIPLLERQAARCVWQVTSPMLDLVAASYPNIEITKQGPAESMDCRLPFTSLPLALRTFSLSDIPSEVPYLRASQSAMDRWRLERRAGECLIGLVWRGRPKPPGRSIALDLLLPVLRQSGVRIVSLQSDCTPDELSLLDGCEAIHFGDQLNSFDDTAAVISQLDLVISVDTAVSHLTGALGKKLWVVLKYGGDWRWLLEIADSPWYPSARLYRQSGLRDWSNVVAEIGRDLLLLLEAAPSD